MKEVVELEAEGGLGQLFERVEPGEEIVITGPGKAVGHTVPPGVGFDNARGGHAAARIRAMRKGVTPGGLAIRDLIDEGRRGAW